MAKKRGKSGEFGPCGGPCEGSAFVIDFIFNIGNVTRRDAETECKRRARVQAIADASSKCAGDGCECHGTITRQACHSFPFGKGVSSGYLIIATAQFKGQCREG